MSSVNLFSILFDRSLAFGRQKKDEAATEKSSSCNINVRKFAAMHESGHSPSRLVALGSLTVAIGRKADVECTSRNVWRFISPRA